MKEIGRINEGGELKTTGQLLDELVDNVNDLIEEVNTLKEDLK